MKTIDQILTAVVNEVPASAGTLRSRMLDVTRGTEDFGTACASGHKTIDAAAKRLNLRMVRVPCSYTTGRGPDRMRLTEGWAK